MIISVYKPRGWTSNDAVQKIKHGCKFKKVGHAGTLDPLAEGVLLVLTDADTKRQSELMDLKKEYLVKLAFGYASASHDLGTPLNLLGKSVADMLTRDKLDSKLGKYLGTIQQQVPAYSAVHVDGQRLYDLVRKASSISLPLPSKDVDIYELTICSFTNNEQLTYPELKESGTITCTTVELRVSCGKGTYIRALVRDLGEDLGCGAVAVSLLRTKVGDYKADNCLSVDKVVLKYSQL